MINVIKKEKGNVLLKASKGDGYFANLAFSPNGNMLDAIHFNLEMIPFDTEEDRDNYIKNTIIVSDKMDCFETIARNVYFDSKIKEGDKAFFCIEPILVMKHFWIDDSCYVIAGKSRLGIHLWIYLNSKEEDFKNLGFPNVEPIDIYTYPLGCEELSSSFLIKYK